MITQTIHLKDSFPFLGEDGLDPILTTYIQENMIKMGRENQKRPAILVCPGGGYANVCEREAEPIALQFLPAGFNVFVLTYSVLPYTYPAQLREVAAAMELLYQNADKWHVDTDRIAILGFSAGGHLAGHYSNCYDIPEVRQWFPESKPVCASLLCYPVVTANPRHCNLGSFLNLLGKKELTGEEIEKFSLENHVSDRTPPTFLWHTASDNCVPVMNTILYAQALAQHKRPFAVHIYPEGVHGLSTADEQTVADLTDGVVHASDWLDAARKWLKLTL